jgi:hypothetical protein
VRVSHPRDDRFRRLERVYDRRERRIHGEAGRNNAVPGDVEIVKCPHAARYVGDGGTTL